MKVICGHLYYDIAIMTYTRAYCVLLVHQACMAAASASTPGCYFHANLDARFRNTSIGKGYCSYVSMGTLWF